MIKDFKNVNIQINQKSDNTRDVFVINQDIIYLKLYYFSFFLYFL